ncbi:MAG: hypothetical protein H7A48_14755 [Akkermansiaceae bacterium]|nr:hypothetical protein [Akkermansiaceae bacterium]
MKPKTTNPSFFTTLRERARKLQLNQRYRPGALVEARVVGCPENGIVKVRPTADPSFIGIIPSSMYPAAWKVAGRPDVTAGDVLKARVAEFMAEDPSRDGQPRLVLDLGAALPNPYRGLSKLIGSVVRFEIKATSQIKGLLVKLTDYPDIVAAIPPADISLNDPEKLRPGYKYDAVVIDLNEDAQRIELSMTEAMRRRGKQARPTAR